MFEGSLRGELGLFPAACVQEIRMKSYENRNNLAPPAPRSGKGKKDENSNKQQQLPRMKKMYVVDYKTR